MKTHAGKFAALLASGAILVSGVCANVLSANALTVIAQIQEIRVDDAEISVGETAAVEVIWDKVTGSSGIKDGLYFTSDHPEIAAVDRSGNITGISPGTAVIAAVNSPYEKSLTITVTERADVLPEWIPQDFSQAMGFENSYGKTHIADGVVCCVWREKDGTTYQTADDTEAGTVLADVSYTYVYPEKPDESDTEAYEKYLEELKAVGFNEFFVNNGYLPDFKYHVRVYAPDMAEDAEFTVKRTAVPEESDEAAKTETLSFRVENGEITETDILGWMPDCITEYNDFTEKNGTVAIRGNNVIYCAAVDYSTGEEPAFRQEGTTELEKVTESVCSKVYAHDLFAGVTTYSIEVYQPISDGRVDVTWSVNTFDTWYPPDESRVVRRSFEISENGTVITNVTDTGISGDINCDGEFSIADITLMQKWLMSGSDSSSGSWETADLCKDGRIDAFDMAIMRRMLIEGFKPEE